MLVIVLNWHGADDTVRCVRSVRDAARGNTDVLVIDNGSGDAELHVLRSALPETEVLALPRNLGYAGGNNEGIRAALERGYDVIGVLNNDTIAAPYSFDRLRDTIAQEAGDVAVTPLIRYDDGGIWFVGAERDPRSGIPVHVTELRSGPAVRPTAYLSGCAIFARSDVWRRVGTFRDDFFLIFEDSEWSLRARDLGVVLLVDTQSELVHLVSRSLSKVRAMSTYFYVRNGLRTLRVDRAGTKANMARFAWTCSLRPALRAHHRGEAGTLTVVAAIVAIATGLAGRPMGHAPRFLRGGA